MKTENEKKNGGVKDAEVDGKDPKVFANLTFDKGFKIVLGTEGRSEKLLMALLNRLLDLKIVDLRFTQTEKLGLTEDDGESYFDVYCKDKYGRRFLVEMQMSSQPHFNKRSVYYSSFAVQDQARDAKRRQKEEGRKWDYDFDPVYMISFLNYKSPISEASSEDPESSYISHYIYRSRATGKALEDDTNLIFIDLYRFRKSFEDCTSDIDKWLFSIKYMHQLNDFPNGIDGTELEDLYDEAKLAAWKPDLRTKYERFMGNKHDWDVSLQYEKDLAREEGLAEGRERGLAEGREKGIELGLEEGRAEGRAEANREVAKSLLQQGIDVQAIVRATGLSVEELRAL